MSAPEDPGIDAQMLAWLDREMHIIFGKLEFHGTELTRANRLLRHVSEALAEGRVPGDLPGLRVIEGGAGTASDEDVGSPTVGGES